MARQSFAEILQSRLQKDSSETQAASLPLADRDPAGLAFLLGQVDRFQFPKIPQYPRAGARTKAPVKPIPPPLLKPQRPQNPAHTLSSKEKVAFAFFYVSSQPLLPDFTLIELKRSYRRLALQWHPDRSQGHSEQFIQLKAHYELLRKLVDSIGD